MFSRRGDFDRPTAGQKHLVGETSPPDLAVRSIRPAPDTNSDPDNYAIFELMAPFRGLVYILADGLDEEFDSFTAYMELKATGQGSVDECWARVFTNEMQLRHIRNFAELAKIALVMPIGSVENERQFSLTNYTKNESRNRMGPEVLNAICRIKRSSYSVDLFPYRETIRGWKETRPRRGLNH